jgi:HEAT repeat protein
MRFLLVLLLLCAPAVAAVPVIELDEDTPNQVIAVEALIERFDDSDVIVRYVPWEHSLPAFVAYAEAVATFGDCAVGPLMVALQDENPQVRVAAAIALEAVGPAAIEAKPLLIEMLQSDDDRTNILACGIIRGIGPGAGELTDLLKSQLCNQNFHVQYWSCRALGGIGTNAEPAVGMLSNLLVRGVASVRRNAATALGDIAVGLDQKSQDDIVQALQLATTDWSHCVCVAAREALLKIENFKKNPC